MALVVPRRVRRVRPHSPVALRIPCVVRLAHAVGRLFSRGQR